MPSAIPRQLRAVFARIAIALILLGPPIAFAQQADIPPALEDPEAQVQAPAQAEQDRIVDGRPAFYGVRKSLNPISWIAAGVRPMLRSAEKIRMPGKSTDDGASDVFGIKFGVRGHGQGSGLGPEVKFFHKNRFNKGIKAEVPLSVTYKRYQLAMFKVEFPPLGVAH